MARTAINLRGLNRWLLPYLRQAGERTAPRDGEKIHLLLCIADHFEPRHGNASPAQAQARIDRWLHEFPRLFRSVHDSDGRPPRHTFFYPLEEYDEHEVEKLAALSRQGFAEVAVQLHHDGDNAAAMRRRLLEYKSMFADRHGLLARQRDNGEVKYAFVHGNWALDNSRPDGRWCGVDNELQVLRETGCYADFTMPSAPDATQTRQINSIYYARGYPGHRKSHDRGTKVGAGPIPRDALMLIQGPLMLNWRRRKWGFLPRIENGCIQGNQPPSIARLAHWLKARIQIAARPDWFFVKLHTHGAIEANQRVLLGDAMMNFHEGLADLAARNSDFQHHYVTARETYNLVRAAEAGWTGSVDDARDWELVWPAEKTVSRPQQLKAATTEAGL